VVHLVEAVLVGREARATVASAIGAAAEIETGDLWDKLVIDRSDEASHR